METPPGIFGLSKKSALKYGSDFNKSGRKVRFDDSKIDVQLCEIQAEREQDEIELEQKLMAQKVVDEMFMKFNGIPFGGAFNTPPPMDPRQIMQAREKMHSALRFSPPRSAANFVVNTPPVNNFKFSRFGAIGTGRPSSNFQSSYKSSTDFGNSKNLNASNINNKFDVFSSPAENGATTSAFNTSNIFSSSSHHASNNFTSSHVPNNFNSSSKGFNSSNRWTTDSHKTALCNQFKDTGTCSYGSDCKYAHGIGELRTPPSAKPNYKTVLCRNFIENNECPHGARCKFIHHRREGSQFQSSSATSIFAVSRGRR